MADRLDSEISRKLWEDVFVKAHERARAPPSLLADGLQETLADEGMLGDERSWPYRRRQNRVRLGFLTCWVSIVVYIHCSHCLRPNGVLSTCPLLWMYCFRSHM